MNKQFPSHQQFGDYIRTARSKRYPRAKDFHQDKKLSCSYSMYSFIETGRKLPAPELLLEIGIKLKLNLNELLTIWLSTQINNESYKKLLKTEIPNILLNQKIKDDDEAIGPNLDNTLILTRPVIEYFLSDYLAYELFLYITAGNKKISFSEIQSTFSQFTLTDLKKKINRLQKLGLIEIKDNMVGRTKEYTYTPDDEHGAKLRNLNFINSSKAIIARPLPDKIKQKKAFRTTFTRLLNETQVSYIYEHLENLVNETGKLSDSSDKTYSLCLLFGERFERSQ